MALGDVYKLVLAGNIKGQSTKNIFWFKNAAIGGSANQLGNAFKNTVATEIIKVCSSDLTLTDVEVENIYDETDTFNTSFSFAGQRSGNITGPFDAWGFTYNPVLLNYKAGGKRFAGTSAIDLADGYPTGTMQSLLDTLAGILGTTILVGLVQYVPYLKSVRCVKDADNHCTDEFVTRYVKVGAVSFDYYTTQNSRKYRTTP